MTQTTTPFVERLRAALGTTNDRNPVVRATRPVQRKGVDFAERLRAALPKR